MRYLYNNLNEDHRSTRMDESSVGVFYIINDEIYSDTASLRNAEEYGGMLNYGSHYDFYYDELCKYYGMPWLKDLDYDYYPRGRVIFDRNEHKYVLYLDPALETDHYISMIADEFDLHNGGFYIDHDEHYKHSGKDVA